MSDASQHSPNHIFLIGFMGSGKSTIARKLARRYGRVSFDIDIGIARMKGKSIPKIFAQEGEQAFRQYELEYLEYLEDKPSSIISCGGGIITTKECRDKLRELGFVVFLEVDANEALSRISSTKSRPLLSNGSDPQALLEKRMPLYLEVADLRFDTSNKSANQVTKELGEELQKRGLL